VIGPFNSREIATAIWLLVVAWWALRKAELRKSLADVVRAFCRAKILAWVFVMLLYVVGLVSILRALGMWDVGLIKDTIVWFFVGALAMMMRFTTAGDSSGLFRKMVADNIKVVIVLEFLVNTCTFPLAIELVLVPAITVIAVIDAVASMNKEHLPVANITTGLLSVGGLVILGIALRGAIADLHRLNSLATVRSIALAPVLSVCMFPFVYIMLVISQYEQLFIRIDSGTEKPTRLKRYIRRRVMMHAGLRLSRLRDLQRHHMVDLMHVGNDEDADRILSAGDSEKTEQSPPTYQEGREDASSGSAKP